MPLLISQKKRKNIDTPDFPPDSDMNIRIQTMSQRVFRIINLIVFSLHCQVSQIVVHSLLNIYPGVKNIDNLIEPWVVFQRLIYIAEL